MQVNHKMKDPFLIYRITMTITMVQLDLNTNQDTKIITVRIATDEKCFTFDIHYNNVGYSKQCYIVCS